MTLSEAENLIEQIRRDEPAGRIVATWDGFASKPNHYHVRVELVRQERVIFLNKPDEWESVKMAWSIWLPGLYEEKAPRGVKYWIDGLPMTVSQRENGYWIGQYVHNGERTRVSLGKDDPRKKYPKVEKEEEEKVG